MSHEHESPTPKNISSEDRFDHSGKRGFEKPVREFDNTTLEEAHDMGLIDTPESPAGLPQEKNRKPLIIGGSALAAALIAGGAWLGLSGGDKATEPRVEPTASAPASPGDAEPSAEAPVESGDSPTELTVERYQDGDSLVRAYNAEYNDWMMSGATPETQANQDFSVTADEYIDGVNAPIDDAYVKALFVDDWQDRPQLVDFVAEKEQVHHAGVFVNMLTTDSGNLDDLEPYNAGWNITSVNVDSQSATEIVTSYRYERWDNSDRNGANQILAHPIDGVVGGVTVTFINVDGVWKISDVK